MLAIKGLGQFERFKAASVFRQLIENWHVSDFHINLARGSKDAAGPNEHLSVTGDNLQLVAQNILESSPHTFDRIVQATKRRIPGIEEIVPVSTQDGRLLLRFRDGAFSDPFIDKYVSDGTIKMFAYLILLYDPEPHPLLCIEEPENQLYPDLLSELAEEFRSYAAQGRSGFCLDSFARLSERDRTQRSVLARQEQRLYRNTARSEKQAGRCLHGRWRQDGIFVAAGIF